jgi:hypothetical protein
MRTFALSVCDERPVDRGDSCTPICFVRQANDCGRAKSPSAAISIFKPLPLMDLLALAAKIGSLWKSLALLDNILQSLLQQFNLCP